MSENEIVGLFGAIKVWKQRGVEAPHKPLLLLLALGALQRNERLLPFAKVEPLLESLLVRFGSQDSKARPLYPFWRLQNDGLWEVLGAGDLKEWARNTDPKVTELRAKKVSGGFPIEIYSALRSDDALLRKVALGLLTTHFPASLHQNILDSVGLTVPAGGLAREPKLR